MNQSLLYIGLNLLIVFVGIVQFNSWSMIAAGLAGLNAYGQYRIMKGAN